MSQKTSADVREAISVALGLLRGVEFASMDEWSATAYRAKVLYDLIGEKHPDPNQRKNAMEWLR